MNINELMIYRGVREDSIIRAMAVVLYGTGSDEGKGRSEELSALAFEAAGRLIGFAEQRGVSGNLWQAYLAYILMMDENPYSLSMELKSREKEEEGYGSGLERAALSDFKVIKELFDSNLHDIDSVLGTDCMSIVEDYVNQNGKDPELAAELKKAEDPSEFMNIVTEWYRRRGVGEFSLHKAFRVEKDGEGRVKLIPVMETSDITLFELVGYEAQKKKLRDNTEAFIEGRKANNCLLFGPSGTGKSSSVKGLLNEYHDRGLRIIELYKHQLKELFGVMSLIRGRNYSFIIYMDDLSFEDFETDYKYLKAVIEGGIEIRGRNVLIYATSNRRHLIRENFKDREEGENDLHKNDTVQEKLSLAYRFPVTIYYGSPDKKEFNNIVKTLAKRYNIDMPEDELFIEANRWELSHGGLSGRTARAFVDYLCGTRCYNG